MSIQLFTPLFRPADSFFFLGCNNFSVNIVRSQNLALFEMNICVGETGTQMQFN